MVHIWPKVIFLSGAFLFGLALLDAALFRSYFRINSEQRMSQRGKIGPAIFSFSISLLTPVVIMHSWILINTIPRWGIIINIVIIACLIIFGALGHFRLDRKRVGVMIASARTLLCISFAYSLRTYYNFALGPGGF